MPVTVSYDIAGNISGVIISPTNSPVGYFQPKPGERVTELEEGQIHIDLANPSPGAQLREQLKKIRIDPICLKTKLRKIDVKKRGS